MIQIHPKIITQICRRIMPEGAQTHSITFCFKAKVFKYAVDNFVNHIFFWTIFSRMFPKSVSGTSGPISAFMQLAEP